jgi:ribosomal protein S4
MTKRLNAKYKVCKKTKGIHKNIWGVAKATKFRSVKILKRNSFAIKQKFNKLSAFNKRLQVKQGLKHFYSNVSNKTFQQLLKKSIKSQSKTINKLISLLESRIDNILYRACFVNSLRTARQLINHGFIFVNSKQIRSTQIVLFGRDFLEIKNKNILLQNKLIHILKQCRFKRFFNIIDSKRHFASKNNNFSTTNLFNTDHKQFFSTLTKSLNYKNRNFTSIFKKICLKYNHFLYIKKTKKVELVPLYLEVNYKILKVVFLWDPKLIEVYYPIKLKYKKHNNSPLFSYNEVLYND